MKQSSGRTSPHRAWLIFFVLWLILLSGVLSSYVGSPGALQAFRLKRLLGLKQVQLSSLKNETVRLRSESVRLEKNHPAQLREIRRVLGYAAKDELIFDFTPSGQF